MGFQLPKGIKYNVDRLGERWVPVRTQILEGTDIWKHAARIAARTYFQKGFGFPRLTHDDCDCRIFPQQNRIAFAWGYRHLDGEVWYAANVYRFDEKIKEQLLAKGLIPGHVLQLQ